MKRVLLAVMVTVVMLAGCGNPIKQCGTFTFNGEPSEGGVYLTNSFAFNPSACSVTLTSPPSSCTSNSIAYIQILRIIDEDTGEFVAPNSWQTARIVQSPSNPPTLNGWAVDRASGMTYGYFGMENDGTSFGSDDVPGNNTKPTVLTDWPGQGGTSTDEYWWDAVDVPVCMDPKSACLNYFLGYYYWLFTTQPGPPQVASNPFSEVGVDWMRTAAIQAVQQWNLQAATGIGTHGLPVFGIF